MEIRVLNKEFGQYGVIDVYESLMWTESYQEYGNFELVLQDTTNNRNLLKKDRYLVRNPAPLGSNATMIIESILSVNKGGKLALLLVKGRCLKSILTRRAYIPPTSTKYVDHDPDGYEKRPADREMRRLVEMTCTNTSYVDEADIIPGLVINTSANSPKKVQRSETVGTTYEAVLSVAQESNLGFRIDYDYADEKMHFKVVFGLNRTSDQEDRDKVIFRPDMETLSDTKNLDANMEYKNYAEVFSDDWKYQYGVRADWAVESVTGLDRRVLIVDANDIKKVSNEDRYKDMLRSRALKELAKYKKTFNLDGSINFNGVYTFGDHYKLGDLVEINDLQGARNKLRVGSYTWSYSGEGEGGYPNFSNQDQL